MTTTPKRIVSIGGIEVDARWSFHYAAFADEDEEAPRATFSGTIELDDRGEPSLSRLVVDADPPLELAEIRNLDLVAHVRGAVVQHLAAAVRGDRGESSGVLRLEEIGPAADRRYAQSLEIATNALGRRRPGVRLEDDFLRGIVDLFNREGIEAVVESTDVSERTARRWLATARARGMR